jgi:hypothetical protein
LKAYTNPPAATLLAIQALHEAVKLGDVGASWNELLTSLSGTLQLLTVCDLPLGIDEESISKARLTLRKTNRSKLAKQWVFELPGSALGALICLYIKQVRTLSTHSRLLLHLHCKNDMHDELHPRVRHAFTCTALSGTNVKQKA